MSSNLCKCSNLRLNQNIFIVLMAGLLFALPVSKAQNENKLLKNKMIAAPKEVGNEIKRMQEIEIKRIKERDQLFIEGKKIIDDYLSSKGNSINKNSMRYEDFLLQILNDGHPELHNKDKWEPVFHYIVTVLELEPDTSPGSQKADKKAQPNRKTPN
jgi:hypothetical protein